MARFLVAAATADSGGHAATPPPAIDVRPERGDTSLRLEVTGRSLISMDVRVRVERGAAEQTLDLQGDALVVEERRLYE